MSALVFLALTGVWLWLGRAIWRMTLARLIVNAFVRRGLGLALAAVWLAAPWADEWLGAREFERLCDAMPEVKFHGPVSVGAGSFFDEQGRRLLWTQREIEAGLSPFPTGDVKLAYAEGRKFESAMELEFKRTTTSRRVRDWPVPVIEDVTTHVHVATGKVTREDHWLGSPGGWIKRLFGWGSHAPYSCSKQSTPYPRELWISY